MFARRSRITLVAVIGFGLVAALLAALLGTSAEKAVAQGIMTAPACQCSATTPIPGMSTNVVHCLCGGMSCVVSEHTSQGRSNNLMQCVR